MLRWVVEGETNDEIAAILGLSLSTVETHMSHILGRLGVDTRAAAVSRVFHVAHLEPVRVTEGPILDPRAEVQSAASRSTASSPDPVRLDERGQSSP